MWDSVNIVELSDPPILINYSHVSAGRVLLQPPERDASPLPVKDPDHSDSSTCVAFC